MTTSSEVISTVVICLLLSGLHPSFVSPSRAQDLERPNWGVGDSWIIETDHQLPQVREADSSGGSVKHRWKFAVAATEKIGDRDCFRIDIEPAAKRPGPKTSLWIDRETVFLWQMKTQLMVFGRYRTMTESFEPGPGGYAPVITSLTAIPVDLPAFLPKGSKRADDTFTVGSRAGASGSKDLETLTFAASIRQAVGKPGAKALDDLPRGAKSLTARDRVQVTLNDRIQIWEKGQPWAAYSDNGHTTARLISVSRKK